MVLISDRKARDGNADTQFEQQTPPGWTQEEQRAAPDAPRGRGMGIAFGWTTGTGASTTARAAGATAPRAAVIGAGP